MTLLEPTDNDAGEDKSKAASIKRVRMVWATIAASIIFVLTFYCTYINQAQLIAALYSSVYRMKAVEMQKELDKYVIETGVQPQNLSDVPAIRERFGQKDGAVLDGYQHPYRLITKDKRVIVISNGHDGAPGGEGLDADISGDDQKVQPLTFRQFLEHANLFPITLICIFSAFFTGYVAYGNAPKGDLAQLSLRRLLVTALITGAFAIAIGTAIAAVHIPNGH